MYMLLQATFSLVPQSCVKIIFKFVSSYVLYYKLKPVPLPF